MRVRDVIKLLRNPTQTVICLVGTVSLFACGYFAWEAYARPGYYRTREYEAMFGGAATLFAASIVFYQIGVLKDQIQLDAFMRLEQEWNSPEMINRRRAAWKPDCDEPDEETVEGVLEFLERASTFANRGMIAPELVWDTFGWYLLRYYHYGREAIKKLRVKWTNTPDPTLYQELEKLYNPLLKRESKERGIQREDVVKELDDNGKKKLFIESERSAG